MPTYGRDMARQNQLIQIREVTPGTLNTGGTKVLRSDMQPGSEPFQPNERWVTRAIQGFNAAGDAAKTFEGGQITFPLNPRYGLLAYILDEMCGAAFSDTNIDTGTRRKRQWRLPETGRVPRETESMFYGQPESAMELLYVFLTSFEISNSRSGDTAGNVSYYANQVVPKQPWPGGTNEVQSLAITGTPDGGTFTISGTNPLTGDPFETGDIDFDATASEVQTALVAVLGTGNVACTGGPLPGSAVTITFQGSLGSRNIALMTTTDSLTGGTSPESAITTTTPGVTAALVAPLDTGTIESNHWSIYRATDKDDLDTIDMDDPDDPHKLTVVEEHTFTAADLAMAHEVEEGKLYATSHVDGETNVTLNLTVVAGEDADSILETGDGCRAEKMYISPRARCGGEEFWIDLYCARNDAYGYDNNNNVRRNSIPLARMTNVDAYNDDHGSCVFTLIEPI